MIHIEAIIATLIIKFPVKSAHQTPLLFPVSDVTEGGRFLPPV